MNDNEYFTARGVDWVRRAFNEHCLVDKRERAMRFFEEAAELGAACGLARLDTELILARVFNRPEGNAEQEAAGAYFTLLVLCHAYGINLTYEMMCELVRVDNPEQIARIREKHAGKAAIGIGSERALERESP